MTDPGKLGPAVVLVSLIAVCVVQRPGLRAAQPAGGPRPAAADAEGPDEDLEAVEQPRRAAVGVFGRADRTAQQWLTGGRQLLELGRYAEAMRLLGAILDETSLRRTDDYFLPPDSPSSDGQADWLNRSLKTEARLLIGQSPRAGREAYELQFGALARHLCTEAALAGDAEGLAAVSRRYFHTEAGHDATFLLGLQRYDHARPLAAALILERLRKNSLRAARYEPALSLIQAACWARSGMPDTAREVLHRLKQYRVSGQVEIGGRNVDLFGEDTDPLVWLGQVAGLETLREPDRSEAWTMLRGNAVRNASASGEYPVLSLCWRVTTTDDPFVETLLEQFRHDDEEQDRVGLPGLHPLVVRDTVLMRTVLTLQGVDLVTGKRIWEVPTDDPFDSFRHSSPQTLLESGPQIERGLRLRMWADATYGTLSSDGELVFNLQDLRLDLGGWQTRILFQNRGGATARSYVPWNRLAAYRIRSGKLAWQIGGPPAAREEPLAGAFFLGPPLPLMGSLYSIAEKEGEIRLVVLDAQSGELAWGQRLAEADRPLLLEPIRRFMGVSPSFSPTHGVLVCPTSNRSVVAVDLATRSLRWGYAYSPVDDRDQPDVRFFAVRRHLDASARQRWFDSGTLVADDYVLLTPADSDELHCLNVADGKLVWKLPRGDALYLACVHNGTAVLVEEGLLRAVKLAAPLVDGRPQPAWEGRTVRFPTGVHPSGFGFASGGFYHVPLSSAEVMTVNLDSGEVAHVAKSRDGHTPGNLVCYKDRIISQRSTVLDAFWESDTLRREISGRLARNADDASALLLQGQILWDDGQLADATQCFRRAHVLGSPEARELLRSALLDGLREDFAAYRGASTELEKLVDAPEQRATLLRLMAAGFEESGEHRQALDRYIQLMDLDGPQPDLVSVSRDRSLRLDRLVQVRLADLRGKMSASDLQYFDRLIQSRRAEATAEEDPRQLARYLDYFGAQPDAEGALGELADKLAKTGEFLRAELALRKLGRADSPQQAASALARWAGVLREAGRTDDAATCYRWLEERFADVPCLDGKKIEEWKAKLPANSTVRRAMAGPESWASGQVECAVTGPDAPVPSSYHRQMLRFTEGRAPFFQDTDITLDRQKAALVATDGYGRQRWLLSLAEEAEQNQFRVSAGFMRLHSQDHLLLVSMAGKLLAVDSLGTPQHKGPRVVWTRDLAARQDASRRDHRARVVMANLPAGAARFLTQPFSERGTALPLAVSDELVCISQFRHLIAMDPATGETVWSRHDLKPDSRVFGDHQFVFVVPPEGTAATVLATRDGSLLGQREIPASQIATLGCRILAQHDVDGHEQLRLHDPWDGTTLWSSREFTPGSQITLVDQQAAAVFEPEGRLALIDLAEGRPIVDTQLGQASEILRLSVLSAPGLYFAVAHLQDSEDELVRTVQPIGGVSSETIERARVYAFDDQGKALWPSPLEIEDQCLPLDQPELLPVLAFVCAYKEPLPTGRTETGTSLLCVDKRTGRVVCEEHFKWRNSTFHAVGDPEKQTVQIQLQRATVTLTFTDKPWKDQTSSGDVPKTFDAVFRALRNAAAGKPTGPRRSHVITEVEQPEDLPPLPPPISDGGEDQKTEANRDQ
jgi:outer membrane protein assembly factor BamB/tetratricopeptide (TPR) repeat protein